RAPPRTGPLRRQRLPGLDLELVVGVPGQAEDGRGRARAPGEGVDGVSVRVVGERLEVFGAGLTGGAAHAEAGRVDECRLCHLPAERAGRAVDLEQRVVVV